MWKFSSYWYKSFDDMAKKTMLRQLISSWGVMSIEMQTAMIDDNSALKIADNGDIVQDAATVDTEGTAQELHTEPPAVEQSKERENPAFAAPEAEEVVEMVDLSQL